MVKENYPFVFPFGRRVDIRVVTDHVIKPLVQVFVYRSGRFLGVGEALK